MLREKIKLQALSLIINYLVSVFMSDASGSYNENGLHLCGKYSLST